MKRWLPVLIALLVTVGAVGSAVGVNAVTGSMIRPDEADLALLEDGAAPGSAGGAPDLAAERRAAARNTNRVKSERDYLNIIMGRNIFDPDLIAEWNPNKADGGDGAEPITDLKVRLVGTVVAEPEVYSSAYIAKEGEDELYARGYSIGQKIQDAEVVAIEDLRVTLKRGDGRLEVLTASEEKPSKGPSRAASSSSGGEGGVEQISENEFVVDRALIDEYIGDIEGISKMGRALLHRGPDGEFDGYRLSAIRRNTLADQLGIKNGDVVHSVNGQPLNSVQNAMNAYQSLMNEGSFTFEVTRRGQKKTMEYTVR